MIMKRLAGAKLPYLLMFSLLVSGCSSHHGNFSSFELPDTKGALTNKQAAEKFWASVRPKSNLADGHYRLGLHYQQIGAYDKAIGEFSKALRNDKSYCKAFNGIAMTYDLLKRCETALDTYEEAIRCAPGEAYVYNNYACSSLLCGNYGKGIELLRKAESLAASDTRIKNNLRIARTLTIRENLSGYLVSGNPPPAVMEQKQPIPAQQTAQSDHGPTRPIDRAPSAVVQDAHQVAGDLPPPPEKKESTGPETPPPPPQPGKTVGSSGNDEEILAVVSAIPPPAPIKVAIEVSNGNGTTGMAKRSADFLRGHGFTVRSITNADHFRFAESVIFYREEHLQAAKDLAAAIPGPQALEKVESMAKTSIGVRLLLGRDLANLHFPEDGSELADYRQSERLQSAVVTASNDPVH